MKYTFETTYNQESLSVMAKCLRKTIRKQKSRRSHILGWAVVILAIVLSFASGDGESLIDLRKIITWAAAAAIVIAFLFEDQMNGYFAQKRMLKGTEKAVATFDTDNPDSYVSETEIGKSEFAYNKLMLIAETERYFVFIFSENHAQVYDKRSLTGGTAEEFKNYIGAVTNSAVVMV